MNDVCDRCDYPAAAHQEKAARDAWRRYAAAGIDGRLTGCDEAAGYQEKAEREASA